MTAKSAARPGGPAAGKAAAMPAGNETSLPLPPCQACNGVDCGTPRVKVCCGGCTHV